MLLPQRALVGRKTHALHTDYINIYIILCYVIIYGPYDATSFYARGYACSSVEVDLVDY